MEWAQGIFALTGQPLARPRQQTSQSRRVRRSLRSGYVAFRSFKYKYCKYCQSFCNSDHVYSPEYHDLWINTGHNYVISHVCIEYKGSCS